MADSIYPGKSDSGTGPSATVTDSASVPESIDVLPDGGVVKRILQEGSGDVPPLHARCLGACAGKTVTKCLHLIINTQPIIFVSGNMTSSQC